MRFRKIYLEIGNVCNLQCSFCPEVERGKKRLSVEEVRAFLAEVKPHTERVCFHLMGEPLAHPEFAACVEAAATVGVPLEITTNGTLLNPATEAALLHLTVHQVNFSLQSFFDNFPGADPETYLSRVLAFTQRALQERPELYINFRLWNLAPTERADTRNESLLQRIEETFSVSLNRRVDHRLTKSKKITGRLYLHYDSRFRWPNRRDPFLREKGRCHGMRSQVAIHADGTVVPCCLDKEADIPLGNLHQTSFMEVIRSARAQKIRQGFESGVLVEDLCQRCEFATRFGD